MSIKFTVTPSFEDFFEMQKLYYVSLRSVRFIKIAGVLAAFMVLLDIFLLKKFDIFTFIFMVSSPVFLFYKQLIFRYRCQRLYKDSPTLHVSTEYSIEKSGIRVENIHMSSMMKWSGFISYKENKNVLALFRTPQQILYIPKRAIQSEREWTELRSFISEHIYGK